MRYVLTSLLSALSLSLAANDSPQALQDAFSAAILGNDADAAAACYTPDAINYPLDAMSMVGPEPVRESWEAFFSANEVLEVDLGDPHVEVHGDTAITWGLFTMKIMPKDGGEAIVMQGRYTDVSRNIDGKWLYVFDHASVPMPGG
jgi:uncharacterized protein (TIGR02246 family)